MCVCVCVCVRVCVCVCAPFMKPVRSCQSCKQAVSLLVVCVFLLCAGGDCMHVCMVFVVVCVHMHVV